MKKEVHRLSTKREYLKEAIISVYDSSESKTTNAINATKLLLDRPMDVDSIDDYRLFYQIEKVMANPDNELSAFFELVE